MQIDLNGEARVTGARTLAQLIEEQGFDAASPPPPGHRHLGLDLDQQMVVELLAAQEQAGQPFGAVGFGPAETLRDAAEQARLLLRGGFLGLGGRLGLGLGGCWLFG